MISTRWIEKRRLHWNRLEQLVQLTGRGSVASLSPTDLQELALLYRQIAADLATVREDPTGTNLAHYLNQLLGRAHNIIYMGRRAERHGILTFYRDTYPAVFRKTFHYTAAAFLLFLFGVVAGGLVALADPSFSRHILGSRMIESIEQHKMWTESIVTIKPVASSEIMTNNISVSIVTFALGITAGIGTVWMLLLNGVLIGVVGVTCWQAGMSLPLWSFVSPHGVLELPAIFIAGGAGFRVAAGLLFPGSLPRGESLVRAGKEGAKLFFGTFPLLLIAGFIEGFVSPSGIPVRVKFLLGAALFSLLAVYLRRASGATYRAQEIDPFEPAPAVKSSSGPLPSGTD